MIKGDKMKKSKGRIGYYMEETAKFYGFEVIETELDPGIEVIARRSSTQIQLSPELRNSPESVTRVSQPGGGKVITDKTKKA